MRSLSLALALLVVGCSGLGSDDLDIQDQGSVVTGTYDGTHGLVSFRGELVGEHVFDLSVELNGLVITALVDRQAGVMEYDGYAADDGGDTQLLDADREALVELAGALDGQASPLVTVLRRWVSTWAEASSTLDLRFQKLAEADRSVTPICWALNSYQSASHDCNQGGWWADNTTLDYVYVSMHAAGSCSDGTYFWTGSAWSCYEPNHSTTIEYAYGNCFGRCGAGCGSDTQFTWDCLDHDECVRFGHDTASWWCDDQFASTSDDWMSAPNCL